MKTQEPINLTSFRNDADRRHSRAVERQYRIALGLVAVLCAATAAAFLTLAPAGPAHVGQDIATGSRTISRS